MNADQISVLVVGCGTMGTSHALAYSALPDFDIVGLVSRTATSRDTLAARLGNVRTFESVGEALAATNPVAVSINTYPESHAALAIEALNHGAHVFVEKPLATTVRDANAVADLARRKKLVVVVGYILRHHPVWRRFIDAARLLGAPLVMRMNLNQRGTGESWEGQKRLMESASPIVDCGVHYVDVMCQMTRSAPMSVHAIGARLSEELVAGMYNYGQLQIRFRDGSVGWYEAGWGPMMSETAHFVKDVIGPSGCLTIAAPEGASDDVSLHTQSSGLLYHASGEASPAIRRIVDAGREEEPTHEELCEREQRYFLRAIRGEVDTSQHLRDAVSSLAVVLAADRSVRTGRVIDLDRFAAAEREGET